MSHYWYNDLCWFITTFHLFAFVIFTSPLFSQALWQSPSEPSPSQWGMSSLINIHELPATTLQKINSHPGNIGPGEHRHAPGTSKQPVWYSPDIRFWFNTQSDSSTQLHYITGVVCWGQLRTPYREKISQRYVVAIDGCATTSTFWLLPVLGTVYKSHPQIGGIDVTMEWFQERNHAKKLALSVQRVINSVNANQF